MPPVHHENVDSEKDAFCQLFDTVIRGVPADVYIIIANGHLG